MVNFAYRAARLHGAMARSVYRRQISHVVNSTVKQTKAVSLSVFSFSSEAYLPEQVASIQSFIRYIGVPEAFTVVSDGSYSSSSSELLKRINSCVNVVAWDTLAIDLPPSVSAFALHHPMGKKLAVLMSMPVSQPTIYADADILFFPQAHELVNVAGCESSRFWYLPDCLPSLDMSILSEIERETPVNAGFLLLHEPLDWEEPIKRLANYRGTPVSATEQTIVHLAMHHNQAAPLSRDKFILSLTDQFVYKDHYAGQGIALRHYVNNVRHKFWQNINLRTLRN